MTDLTEMTPKLEQDNHGSSTIFSIAFLDFETIHWTLYKRFKLNMDVILPVCLMSNLTTTTTTEILQSIPWQKIQWGEFHCQQSK